MARTRPQMPHLSEADKIRPQERTRAVKQPGQSARARVSGKTPAHLHNYTGRAPGGLGKSFYPKADPPRRSRRKRHHRLTLPPLRGPKPQNRVAHEIRYYQNTTNFLIPKAPFEELVRYIAYEVTAAPEFSSWDRRNVRFTPQALQALQEAAEYFLIKTFYKSRRITAVAKRKTCFPEDIYIGLDMRDHGL